MRRRDRAGPVLNAAGDIHAGTEDGVRATRAGRAARATRVAVRNDPELQCAQQSAYMRRMGEANPRSRGLLDDLGGEGSHRIHRYRPRPRHRPGHPGLGLDDAIQVQACPTEIARYGLEHPIRTSGEAHVDGLMTTPGGPLATEGPERSRDAKGRRGILALLQRDEERAQMPATIHAMDNMPIVHGCAGGDGGHVLIPDTDGGQRRSSCQTRVPVHPVPSFVGQTLGPSYHRVHHRDRPTHDHRRAEKVYGVRHGRPAADNVDVQDKVKVCRVHEVRLVVPDIGQCRDAKVVDLGARAARISARQGLGGRAHYLDVARRREDGAPGHPVVRQVHGGMHNAAFERNVLVESYVRDERMPGRQRGDRRERRERREGLRCRRCGPPIPRKARDCRRCVRALERKRAHERRHVGCRVSATRGDTRPRLPRDGHRIDDHVAIHGPH